MERQKINEIVWKQIFQIQKYDLVNWKLKWNINPKSEISTIENWIKELWLNSLKQYKQHGTALLSLKKHNLLHFCQHYHFPQNKLEN